MTDFSRRQFLKQSGALPLALFAAAPGGFSFFWKFSSEPFEFLVVGDSLVWGQGLEEKDKFYTLTKNWLENEIFQNQRSVNLKVKARSGAMLSLPDQKAETLRRVGKDETEYLPPELNVSFPSISTQIRIARQEYESERKMPAAVNLIMVSGGITDISINSILNPFGDDEKLRRDIKKHCYDAMLVFLKETAHTFPNALIALIGYYPIISPQTSTRQLLNFLLEGYGIPRLLRPLANNFTTRKIFRIIRRQSIRRSRIWAELSNRRLLEAVRQLNVEFDRLRAVFIEAPITEETCFGTKNTLLFGFGKKRRTEDALYEARKADCRPFLTELRNTTGLRQRIRICELAAIGHPNVAGARAFAASIRAKLENFFHKHGKIG